jgi:hypothetical protein
VDGLVVLLNELAGMLGSGCLTLIGEDSKPFNSDLFCTGAGAGDVPEVKRSEQVSMASHVNCVEELMTVLGDAASERDAVLGPAGCSGHLAGEQAS